MWVGRTVGSGRDHGGIAAGCSVGATPADRSACVRVVGVGGAGVNAASRLLDLGLAGVRFVALDTSAQTVARAPQASQLVLTAVTRGLGTGGEPRLGAAAVLAEASAVRDAVGGAPAVLVVAGLAGGTGGGAGPEVARLARKHGSFTIGFGIRPFGFEAQSRQAAARRAEDALRSACDCTVILDNERALALAGPNLPLDVALRVADDGLRQAVQGLGALLTDSGWIRVDLAHVQGLLSGSVQPCLALGVARGPYPARAAMAAALASPFTDRAALARARAVLVQVTGGSDLAIRDTASAVEWLRQQIPSSCEVVVGAGWDPALAGAAQVLLLGATVPPARPLIPWPEESLASARIRRQPVYATALQEAG